MPVEESPQNIHKMQWGHKDAINGAGVLVGDPTS
jgi:hypothetical protein